MNLRHLRQRCEARLRDVEIPRPFELNTFQQRLAAAHEREIRLMPMHTQPGPDSPCGLWLAGSDTDYVFYEEATSPLHREHIVLHELGHMLCEHRPAAISESEFARLLLPNLDTKMVKRVLARTSYSRQDEQEAEMVASLILQRSGRPTKVVDLTEPADAAVLERLEATLTQPRKARG